jgi:hypothetical protein
MCCDHQNTKAQRKIYDQPQRTTAASCPDGGFMDDPRTFSEELLDAIDKRSREIANARPMTMTWKEAFDLAQKEFTPAIQKEKAKREQKFSTGFYANRLRRFARQTAADTGLPYESAARSVLDKDPKLAQAVIDEENESKEPAGSTLIAIANYYERMGLQTVAAYKKAFDERPDLKDRYDRLMRRR